MGEMMRELGESVLGMVGLLAVVSGLFFFGSDRFWGWMTPNHAVELSLALGGPIAGIVVWRRFARRTLSAETARSCGAMLALGVGGLVGPALLHGRIADFSGLLESVFTLLGSVGMLVAWGGATDAHKGLARMARRWSARRLASPEERRLRQHVRRLPILAAEQMEQFIRSRNRGLYWTGSGFGTECRKGGECSGRRAVRQICREYARWGAQGFFPSLLLERSHVELSRSGRTSSECWTVSILFCRIGRSRFARLEYRMESN
jgi:hypothetical protein